jgi:hypothetical protein
MKAESRKQKVEKGNVKGVSPFRLFAQHHIEVRRLDGLEPVVLEVHRPQHFLYFFPLLHGHGALRAVPGFLGHEGQIPTDLAKCKPFVQLLDRTATQSLSRHLVNQGAHPNH